MIKKILNIIKKIIMAVFIIYGYNIIAEPLGYIIPLNIVTISLVTILGIPALLSMIGLMIFMF